jgi:hypothetical protein
MHVDGYRSKSRIIVLFVLLANADACGSKSPGASSDAEGDGATSTGGHGSPGKEAGDSEGGLVCDQSIADYCGTSGPAPCQWPANLAAFCPSDRSPTFSASVGRRCTQYQYLREITNVDIGFDAYYDISTGRLIEIVSRRYSGGDSGHCIAGPSDFVDPAGRNQVLPAGCNEYVAIDCADAGAK